MTDTTNTPTLSDLAMEACLLAGMIEGLDVLNDAIGISYSSEHITERRAANAMRPMIEAAIRSAQELTERLGILEDLERKAAREAKAAPN